MSDVSTTNTTTVSTVNEGLVTNVQGGQFHMKTPWLIGALVVALLILKTFIYIKDKKRHGK